MPTSDQVAVALRLSCTLYQHSTRMSLSSRALVDAGAHMRWQSDVASAFTAKLAEAVAALDRCVDEFRLACYRIDNELASVY